jgi:hypothetical protein
MGKRATNSGKRPYMQERAETGGKFTKSLLTNRFGLRGLDNEGKLTKES